MGNGGFQPGVDIGIAAEKCDEVSDITITTRYLTPGFKDTLAEEFFKGIIGFRNVQK